MSTRSTAIADAMADIRAITDQAVTTESVNAVKDRLIDLVADRDLFGSSAFPAPKAGEEISSCLYRIAQDPDDRFALYASACRDHTATPPHDHTTWAVIVGFDGEEVNRRYRGRAGEGEPEVADEFVVRQGTGIAFLPDEVHSIHIDGGALNFHCYGLALERLDQRRFWDRSSGDWKVFPAHPDIREARSGSTTS